MSRSRSRKRARYQPTRADKLNAAFGVFFVALVLIAGALGPWTNIVVARFPAIRLFAEYALAAGVVWMVAGFVLLFSRHQRRSGTTYDRRGRDFPTGSGAAGSGQAGFHVGDLHHGGQFGGGGSSGGW